VSDARAGEDSSPHIRHVSADRFKWGWNSVTGEVEVWSVSGHGDGLPAHAKQLRAAWGREPSQANGDVLGTASHLREGAVELEQVVIETYYGQQAPASIIDWFRQAFPDARIRDLLDS
jgi:hypothetical protein